eukprot:SAG31_NODE_24102_length_489_cov_0.879487_1_plen_75_part_10
MLVLVHPSGNASRRMWTISHQDSRSNRLAKTIVAIALGHLENTSIPFMGERGLEVLLFLLLTTDQDDLFAWPTRA